MEEPTVGDEGLRRKMTEPAVLDNGDTVFYGLGLSVDSHRGLATHGHGGADAGFRTNLLHFPEEELGVVVFGNASSFNAGSKAHRVAEVFLEDRMEPEEDELEPEPSVAVDAGVLEELEGRYRAGEEEMITVERDGEELLARLPDDGTHRLVPESDSTFWAPEPEGRVTFRRDRDGPGPPFPPRGGVGPVEAGGEALCPA